MKNNIKSIVSLTVICAVIAVLLAGVNYISKPYIEANEDKAANAALLEVMPNGKDFKKLDISSYTFPSTVSEVYSEASGGYVFKLKTTGYASDFIIMCGIKADGTVSGTLCISSGETLGYEKTFGAKLVGLDSGNIDSVDTVSGATKTTSAYKGAVKDALNAFIILGGGSVDIRTEAEILADNLSTALPSANGEFSSYFITEQLDSTTAVYSADNGTGYVFLYRELFVGTDKSGIVISDVDASVKQAVEEQARLLLSSKLTRLDLTQYSEIPSSVSEAHKTDSGNYLFVLNASGYGINGGKHASGEYIVIKLSMTAEGRIIACETVSQKESEGLGAACADPSFYTQFNGKDKSNYGEIDAISGATVTTAGYKNAVADAFTALNIIKGGAR